MLRKVRSFFAFSRQLFDIFYTQGILLVLSVGNTKQNINKIQNKNMLKKLSIVAALSLAFIAPTTWAGPKTTLDIVDTAVKAESFKTLVAAVKAAGLVETLKGEGPFTVFAPTDEAFAKLPEGTIASLLKPENKDKLTAILTYHVIPAKVMAKDVKAGKVKTVNGKEVKISVSDWGVKIDNAKVVKTDVSATNGVIHVIDHVILPQS